MGAPTARRYGQAPALSAELQPIADFLEACQREDIAADSKWPVPLLGQYLESRQNLRRVFGHVFVRMMLTMAAAKSEEPGNPPVDLRQESERIFAGLNVVRQGPEGRIPHDVRVDIRTRAQGMTNPAITVGRQVLFALHDHPAYGIADDALLALEQEAVVATTAMVAEDELSAA